MLKSKLLTVDIVKQGTINIRNVVRSFFAHCSRNYSIECRCGKATGEYFADISVWQKYKFEKFGQYCLDIAKLYLNLYPWYNMPLVHKVLLHVVT